MTFKEKTEKATREMNGELDFEMLKISAWEDMVAISQIMAERNAAATWALHDIEVSRKIRESERCCCPNRL